MAIIESLDALLKMSKKDIFEYVIKHLQDQGVQSMKIDVCAYRGINGRACAVGCLIPDEYYKPIFEGKAIKSVLGNYEITPVLGAFFYKHLKLLDDLQWLHDSNQFNNYSCIKKIRIDHDIDN